MSMMRTAWGFITLFSHFSNEIKELLALMHVKKESREVLHPLSEEIYFHRKSEKGHFYGRHRRLMLFMCPELNIPVKVKQVIKSKLAEIDQTLGILSSVKI